MKILFLTAKKDSPSAKWRVLQLLPHLEGAGFACEALELPGGILAKLALCRRAAEFDAVVLQKRLLPKLVFQRLRRSSRRLVFEYDDNPLLKRAEDGTVRTSSPRERRFARTVTQSDAVLTTNPALAALAHQADARPERVHVLPSVIDPTRYRCRPPATAGEALIVGWMGTEANLASLEILRRPLVRLCRRYPGLRVKIVCARALSMEGVRIEHKPFRSEEESADLCSFDIAVAPLVEDPWTRGKISTKILAYYASGLPVVASEIDANRLYVRHGETAFLAGTLSEWEARLEELALHPGLRDRMGKAARAAVEREFSIQAVIPRYAGLFQSLRPSPSTEASSEP